MITILIVLTHPKIILCVYPVYYAIGSDHDVCGAIAPCIVCKGMFVREKNVHFTIAIIAYTRYAVLRFMQESRIKYHYEP